MQAIILAAGRGERMMPLTRKTPKPLLKIAGKPLVEYTIQLLAAHGVQEIGINLYYLGEKIKQHLGDGSRFGVEITYVPEKELTGTAGGVKAIAKVLKFKRPFFVIAPDILANFNLSSIYRFHKKHNGIATLTCYWRPKSQVKKSGVILFDKKTKRIKKFVERPQTEKEIISQWVNSFVYIFNPKIIEYIPNKVDGSRIVDLPRHVFPKLFEAGEKMYAYPIDNRKYYQLGIDTPERLSLAEKDLKEKKFDFFAEKHLSSVMDG